MTLPIDHSSFSTKRKICAGYNDVDQLYAYK